jgi:multidrug resistance protein MdtO
VTIAAMACIAFFTGLQWVSIHTCLITCYYVSEATLGESLHKMTLRITGALVGATIAVACVVFVIPRMDDVGQLAILVFLVATLGGWIGVGSERIAYAGFQITLAFFLVVLESFGTFGLNFGPSFDLEPATGRIIGILVGNLACAFVFLTLWPYPMRDDVARLLGETWERVATGLAGRGPVDPAALLPRVGRAFDLFDYVAFESVPPDRRLGPAWRRASDRTFRLVAVARCLARRRERLGPDGAPADGATVRAIEAGAASLARREPDPPIAPRQPPSPPPPDPLDRALLDRLREIACPSREAAPSSQRSPACSPAA